MESFWTIEARVVDYLGVISRDLGRELSFGAFLSGIAPDLFDPSMSPVISDAYHYRKHILTTHCCELVKYSKRHQQTAVKWIRRCEPPQIMIPDKAEWEAVRQRLAPIETLVQYSGGRAINIHDPFEIDNMLVAKIKGDIEDVKAVRTRLASILTEGSELAKLWTDLRSGAFELREKVSLTEFATIWCAAMVIHGVSVREYTGGFARSEPVQLFWKELLAELDNIERFKALGIQLPDDFRDLQRREYWFDATHYWLDWNR